MPEKSPILYNLSKTNVVFAFASIFLLIGLVMMVFQDSDREWKHYQREFLEYSRDITEKDLEEIEKKEDKAALEALKTQLQDAKGAAGQNQNAVPSLRQELAALKLELTKAGTHFQDLKQMQDSQRYFFEENREHGHKHEAERYEKLLKEREPKLEAAKLKQEELEAARDKKNAEIEKFFETEKNLKREITKLTQDSKRIENKLKNLKPNFFQEILNAPMLDFLKPSLTIQQIVIEDLYDDFYFSKVQKVDRCISCHLGIDQKGFENVSQPFRAHPNLDLFLSPNSPHPIEEFGCTSCHGGGGHSISFVTAAHTPKNKEQAEAWKKEYHWKPMKHWSDKMLPMTHVEASCAKCHTGTVEVPKAPKLNEGRKLAETFGCFACHKVAGFGDRWKVGPSLLHAQSKLEQDWIVRWLQNPKEFRPSTKMPRIFHLSNTSDADSVEKSNAAIAGIASYLIKNSDPVTLQPLPAGGKPEEGKRLIEEVGCLGCHTAGSLAANDHGPELSGLGSKVKGDWLFTWLKDPKHYMPETRMPNLRLTDFEAAHISAYLLNERNEKFESIRPPLVKPETVDDLALSYLRGKMRQGEAKAELEKMNADERLDFVGKQVIAQQGCFGCHNIKGFSASGGEEAKQIGTELTEEGSKDIHKLDFGFIPLDHTREAWFFQKLKEPRIFDKGKVRGYHEKLRMPQFDFTDQQAESLVTFLLSLQKADIPLEMKRTLTQQEEQIEVGRLLVSKLNCQGCHTVDGKTGGVRSIIQDGGNAPPIIDGEGKKVEPHWLYHFLKEPTTIRPWLKYRMPTFSFTDQEATQLVQYFNLLDKVPVSFDDDADETIDFRAEQITAGRELFKTFQCIKCHQSNPDTKLSASFLAPDLLIAKERLRPDWVVDWLKDPQAITAGTMMPAFFPEGQSPAKDILEGDAHKQMEALRDYLWHFTPEEAAAMSPVTKGK